MGGVSEKKGSEKRKGFKDGEKKRMMLSEETVSFGMRVHVHVSMCVHVCCTVRLAWVYIHDMVYLACMYIYTYM